MPELANFKDNRCSKIILRVDAESMNVQPGDSFEIVLDGKEMKHCFADSIARRYETGFVREEPFRSFPLVEMHRVSECVPRRRGCHMAPNEPR